jgi:CheY-like chemotaxis protein
VCRTIVEGLGGTISCESEEGKGTTFRIVLPPAPAEARAEAEAGTEQVDVGPGKVLVVDDDALVGRSVRRVLRGCEVTVAESGVEALEYLETRRFDVILCDLMMPNMTGMKLYEEVCRLHPGVEERMLFMTGGAFTLDAKRFAEEHEDRLLEKPMDQPRLQLMVSGLVETHRAERARDASASTASGTWPARQRDASASTSSGTWPAR